MRQAGESGWLVLLDVDDLDDGEGCEEKEAYSTESRQVTGESVEITSEKQSIAYT